ncbi:MAG: MarR family winged helix-turn-helix transcriptional regulator [Lysobacterales bacterium]|jgi:DNA-binding MarR family transcriptional regulator
MDRYRRGDHWLGKFVPYLIYRITNKLNQRLRKSLRKSGINLARWRVMSVLKDKSALNMGEIVAATIIEQPTVSRIVDQLEREGLAIRKADDKDSRYVQVMLTDEGEEAFAEIYPLATRHQEKALQGFSEEDIRVLTGLLQKILNNIEGEV